MIASSTDSRDHGDGPTPREAPTPGSHPARSPGDKPGGDSPRPGDRVSRLRAVLARTPLWLTRPPLHRQVVWLMLGSALFGVGLARLDRSLASQGWPILLGLGLFAAVCPALVRSWVVRPFEDLAARVARVARSRNLRTARRLPIHEPGPIGQIARATRELTTHAERHARTARRLRKGLDLSVERARVEAVRRLEHLAYRDPLTNLGNRRFLKEQLENLTNLAVATRTPLICIAIDVDHFKQVNDQLGHAAGDELLKLLADLMRQGARHDDLTIRHGGDEFLVLMPGGNMQRAHQFTEQLRTLFIQQVKIRFRSDPAPNLSMGVAKIRPGRCETGRALVHAADQAMYEAKRRGKGTTAGVMDCVL